MIYMRAFSKIFRSSKNWYISRSQGDRKGINMTSNPVNNLSVSIVWLQASYLESTCDISVEPIIVSCYTFQVICALDMMAMLPQLIIESGKAFLVSMLVAL